MQAKHALDINLKHTLSLQQPIKNKTSKTKKKKQFMNYTNPLAHCPYLVARILKLTRFDKFYKSRTYIILGE